MTKQRLNIELFKKIRDRIAAKPDSYSQEDWCSTSRLASCGTAACLAGHAVICSAPSLEEGLKELRKLSRRRDKNHAIPNRAAALLGLSGDWAKYTGHDDEEGAGETMMFHPYALRWPEPYVSRFSNGDRLAAAITYLDHIIETGKVLK